MKTFCRDCFWSGADPLRRCPSCGSPIFGVSDGTGEIAIGLGAFDAAPTDLVPTYELWGAVDPAYRRRGHGSWLMGWTLDRARERASREDPLVPVNLGAFSEDSEIGHRALAPAARLSSIHGKVRPP